MDKVDTESKKFNNQGSLIVIEGEGQQFKIDKRDLQWVRTGNHQHHYLPDFSDETDEYIALVCGVRGCIHGALFKKKGKRFMSWLEKHRAEA